MQNCARQSGDKKIAPTPFHDFQSQKGSAVTESSANQQFTA